MIANYKNILFIVLIFSFFVKTSPLRAQIKGHDLVYLKNGSILKGAIVSTDEDSTVKIMIKGGSILAYPYSQIQKMSFDVGTSKINNPNGVRFQLNFGGLIGEGGGFFSYLSPVLADFDLNVGYQQNKHYYALSSGFEFFDGLSVPLMLNYQYTLSDKSVAPFLEVYGGTGFNVDQYYDSTLPISAGAGVGLKKTFLNNFNFLVNVGYRVHQYKYSYTDWFWGGTTTNTVQANRIQLKFGIGF